MKTAPIKKSPMNVYVSKDQQTALHDLGAPYGMTGNQVLSAAAGELIRAQGNLWHVLGRIAGDDGKILAPAPEPRKLPARPAAHALQVVS